MPYMLDAIRDADHPVALTGAGISAPSGVPTFTSRWKGRPVRDFLGRSYFEHDPVGFFELYCSMEAWCHAEPNAAHKALAAHGVPVITQNIDGLHQRAGSADVVELHGNLRRLLCHRCGKIIPAEAFCAALRPLYAAGDTAQIEKRLRCGCGGWIDVDVVLYGDAVRGMETAADLLGRCDLLVVIGTSLETYPAAMLPDVARQGGAKVLIESNDCIAALS